MDPDFGIKIERPPDEQVGPLAWILFSLACVATSLCLALVGMEFFTVPVPDFLRSLVRAVGS